VNDQIQVILIGVGDMALGSHLPTLKEHKLANIAAIVRSSCKNLNETMPTYSPDQLQEAIRKHLPSLAIIASPHCFHYEQTRTCLSNGCHVLVEKPLALDYDQTLDLMHLAHNSDRLLVVNLQRRYEGAASVYRELMKNSKLGYIQAVHGVFVHRFSQDDQDDNWRQQREKCGEGILDDSAYHLIDLLIYFAGATVCDESLKAHCLFEDGLCHSFSCIFQTKTGVMVSAYASYLSPVDTVQEEITVIGSEGSLFIRRFCMHWNQNPPEVFYKAADGREQVEFDLSDRPCGRQLPLRMMLDVMAGRTDRDSLLTESPYVLETHRAISLIKQRAGLLA